MRDMDHGARVWLSQTARKNYWRVASYYDLDDLIQDGFMLYYKCLERYKDVTERSHMMALFKTTFINHCHDLAKVRSRLPEDLICDLVLPNSTEDQTWDKITTDHEQEFSTLYTMISQAPEPIRAFLSVLNTPEGIKRLRAPYRYRGAGVRETTNERVCRMAGVDPLKIDLVAMIKSYFRRGYTNQKVRA